MSQIRRTEYEIRLEREEKTKERERDIVDQQKWELEVKLQSEARKTALLGDIFLSTQEALRILGFDQISLDDRQNIAQARAMLEAYKANKTVLQTEIKNSFLFTAKNAEGEEVEVALMPNGQLITHAESNDRNRCTAIVEQIHQEVLRVAKQTAIKNGYLFADKKDEAKKEPFFQLIGGAQSQFLLMAEMIQKTHRFSLITYGIRPRLKCKTNKRLHYIDIPQLYCPEFSN